MKCLPRYVGKRSMLQIECLIYGRPRGPRGFMQNSMRAIAFHALLAVKDVQRVEKASLNKPWESSCFYVILFQFYDQIYRQESDRNWVQYKLKSSQCSAVIPMSGLHIHNASAVLSAVCINWPMTWPPALDGKRQLAHTLLFLSGTVSNSQSSCQSHSRAPRLLS